MMSMINVFCHEKLQIKYYLLLRENLKCQKYFENIYSPYTGFKLCDGYCGFGGPIEFEN